MAKYFLLGAFGLFCFALIVAYSQPQTTSIPPSRILITAAHLGEVEGYQCIYADEISDYAVHIKTEYSVEGIEVGGRVDLVGTTGIIVRVSSTEFFVTVENISKIVPGVSGEPVYQGSIPIGFISGWDGNGALRCIFY